MRHLMYGEFVFGPEVVSRYELFDNFAPDIPIRIRNVGRLTSLRTLPSFRVGREKGCQISELGNLKHLAGELCITNLEKINSKEDAAKVDLSRKKNLYGIHFCWSWYRGRRGVNRNEKDVLEGFQPHGNVKSLTIENYSGDSFPAWVAKMAIDIEGKWTPLHKLVKIKLSGCNNCVYLPVLEHLPVLRDLVLEDMEKLTCLSSSSGESGSVNTGSMKPFSPSLRSLSLRSMRSLVQWNADPTTTNSSIMLSPVLESLYISFCPKIIHLNESHLHPLVSLIIIGCENLESIQSIQGLTSLESLSIEDCGSLVEIPYLQNYEHHPLKSLAIVNCYKLTSVPCEIFDCFSLLNKLELGAFSKELHFFPSLQGIEKLRDHLRSLRLKGWSHWKSIPEQVQHLTSLTRLDIWGFGMEELPMWLFNMSSISLMTFSNCKGLTEEVVRRGEPRAAIIVILNGKHLK